MIKSEKLSKFKQIRHGFFDKKGGKSKGIYESLNCGKGSLDNKNNVNKNLRIACNKITRSYKKLILLNQVHSNKFYYLKETGPINKKKNCSRCTDNKTKENYNWCFNS